MIGAPVLAGTASLRLGAGLVQIAMPAGTLGHALSVTPELIGLALPRAGMPRALIDAAKSADAVVIGPGLGQSPIARQRLNALVKLWDKPTVIDADALNLLSSMKRWPGSLGVDAVLTPHPGEMKRLGKLFGYSEEVPSDDAGRIALAARAVNALGETLVLKGERTVVASPDGRVFVNRTGNSALSKAGSGDVLSGMLATLLAQKMETFEASCAAVCLHGLAGEIAGERLGLRSPLARDVIDAVPEAIKRYERL
jgi:NAD(P)H-hydrate epimerase